MEPSSSQFQPSFSQQVRPRATQTTIFQETEFSSKELDHEAFLNAIVNLQTQLTILKKDAGTTKGKTQRQRQEAKKVLKLLLQQVSGTLFANKLEASLSLEDIVRELTQLTEEELIDNQQKYQKNPNAPTDFQVTDVCVGLVRAAIIEGAADAKIDVIPLCILLIKSTFGSVEGRYEGAVCELLQRYSEAVPVMKWKQEHYTALLRNAKAELMERLACNIKRKRADPWLKIVCLLYKNISWKMLPKDIHETVLDCFDQVIAALCPLDYEYFQKETSTSSLIFQLFSVFLDEWGLLKRDHFLDSLIKVASASVNQINGMWTSRIAIQDKYAMENAGEPLWSFLERVLALAAPSCELLENALISPIHNLANDLIDAVISDLIRVTNSNARTLFELPDSRISLLGRILFLSEPSLVFEHQDAVKRARVMSPLAAFCSCDWHVTPVPPSLVSVTVRALSALFSTYHNQLKQSGEASRFLNILWRAKAEFSGAVDQFCHIFAAYAETCQNGEFPKEPRDHEIFEWLLMDGGWPAAARFCATYMARIQPNSRPLSAVIDLLSRIGINSANEERLLSIALNRCSWHDLEELPQLKRWRFQNGSENWRSRETIVRWLIASATVDFSGILFQLTKHNLGQEAAATNGIFLQPTLETRLMDYVLITQQQRIPSEPTPNYSFIVLTDVAALILHHFDECWEQAGSNTGRKVFLWRQLIGYIDLLKEFVEEKTYRALLDKTSDWVARNLRRFEDEWKMFDFSGRHLLFPSTLYNAIKEYAEKNEYAYYCLICDEAILDLALEPETMDKVLSLCNTKWRADQHWLTAPSQLLALKAFQLPLEAWPTEIFADYGHLLTEQDKMELLERLHSLQQDHGDDPMRLVYANVMLRFESTASLQIRSKLEPLTDFCLVLDRVDELHPAALEEYLNNLDHYLTPSIFAPKFARAVLERRILWPNHLKILRFLLENAEALQLCRRWWPQVDAFIEYHSPALLANFGLRPDFSRFKRFTPRTVPNDWIEVVRASCKGVDSEELSLNCECFPWALRCDSGLMSSVSIYFVSQLQSMAALDFLAHLRMEAASAIATCQEIRYLEFLVVLVETAKMSPVSNYPKVMKPLLELLVSCVTLIWQSVNRNTSCFDIAELSTQRMRILKLLPEEFSLHSVYASKEFLMSYKGNALDNFPDTFHAAADGFLDAIWPDDEHVFFCTAFWKAMDEAVLLKLKSRDSWDPRLRRCLEYLILIWDTVPWLRPLITPNIVLLKQLVSPNLPYTVEFNYQDGGGDQAMLGYLGRVCKLMLADYRETSFDSIRFALRLLICPEFGAISILSVEQAADKENQELTYESVPLSQPMSQSDTSRARDVADTPDACYRLLKSLDIGHAVIRTLAKYVLVKMRKICPGLLPYICGLDHEPEIIQPAIRVILACREWDTADDAENPRSARCLAECLDAINIQYLTANIENCDDIDRLRLLADFLGSNGYTNHSKLLYHLFCETVLARLRSTMGLNLGSNLCKLPKEARQFAADLYLRTSDASVLRVLPADFQTKPAIRSAINYDLCDWASLISDEDPKLKAEAHFALGSQQTPSGSAFDDAMYQEAWRLRNWGSLPLPKPASSRDAQLYSHFYMESCLNLDSIGEVREAKVKLEHEYAKLGCSTTQLLAQRIAELRAIEIGNQETERIYLDSTLICARAFERSQRAIGDRQKLDQRDVDSIFAEVESLAKRKMYRPALKTLGNLNDMVNLLPKSDDQQLLAAQCVLEECRILRKTDMKMMAKEKLFKLIAQSDVEDQLGAEIAVRASCQREELALEADFDPEKSIAYALKARDLCAKADPRNSELYTLVHRKLFEASCSQLENIEAYRESKGFRMKREAIEYWDKTLSEQNERKRDPASAAIDSAAVTRLRRERRCEADAIRATYTRLWENAQLALDSGLKAIQYSSQRDATQMLFSVIDLLFRYGEENPDLELKDDLEGERPLYLGIVALFEHHLSVLDTTKWVFAVSHVCSHAFKNTPLGNAIKQLMTKLVIAHPYIATNALLFYDDGAEKTKTIMVILRKATESNRALEPILRDQRKARRLYSRFCQIEITRDPRFRTQGKIDCFIADAQRCELFADQTFLSKIPLPILDHSLDPFEPGSGADDIVCWGRIDPLCRKADGQSRPIILDVIGSDGKKYRMVFKKEDVRQDCLVEQLFSVVNNILSTKKAPHPLRTYKVVPLNEKNGIIEFCSNTISMRNLLCGEDKASGLHGEFYPDDMPATEAITLMYKNQNAPPSEALRVFENICRKMRPAFRHHFYRQFPSAAEWLAQLDAYTTNLAQWCIVCYVVGLGDRHASNILFEEHSSRFVHIDLGMILEYSKRTLPVPEQVPFRLTRDLTDPLLPDGMGRLLDRMTATLTALRSHHRTILGLASVFLRELMSNFKEAHTSRSYTSLVAIDRLRDKLSGRDSSLTALNPEQQVRRLIKEATDVENLARIYCGWMPFCKKCFPLNFFTLS
ncbi:unnamed protein product, partial [Mesorhabditis spiculigera]